MKRCNKRDEKAKIATNSMFEGLGAGILPWLQKHYDRGFEEGFQQGLLEGRMEVLVLDILTARFGPVSESAISTVPPRLD